MSFLASARRSSWAPSYRPDIDGLRALAVAAVLAYHAFPSALKGGFIGVDIFFVISGYLISSILFKNIERGDFSFTDFYGRRIRRIFPALIVVMAATFGAGWFLLIPEQFEQLGQHMAASAGFLENFLLWQQAGYFDAISQQKPLMHLWSLSIEEQFYLIFPFFLWGLARFGAIRKNAIWLVASFGLISLILNLVTICFDPTQTFFAPQNRAWEFMAGAVIAYFKIFKTPSEIVLSAASVDTTRYIRFFSKAQRAFIWKNALSLFGLTTILIAVFVFGHKNPYPGWRAALPVLGTSILIAVGPDALLNRFVIGNRLFTAIGAISYPLYLWHWPILSFLTITHLEDPSISVRYYALLASVVLAALTYALVERPLRLGGYQRQKTFVLCVGMTCVGFAGLYISHNHGLLERFPPIWQNILGYQRVAPTDHWRVGTCFLRPAQDYKAFDTCPDGQSKKPRLFVWGDSYAAHLYPGLVASYGDNFSIIERAAASCAPLLGAPQNYSPNCKLINDVVADQIAASKPQRVILAASWASYDWTALAPTIAALRADGIPEIEVVGPVPMWKTTLSKLLYMHSLLHPTEDIPTRMTFGLDDHVLDVNHKMKTYVQSLGIHYIDVETIMCTDDGCITRFGDAADDLVTFDVGHLNDTASRYVVSHFDQ